VPGEIDNEANATEQPFVDFKCPYCGTTLSFPLDSSHLAQECLNCLEVVIVPQAGQGLGGKLPIPITTPRLVLRRSRTEDWKDLTEYLAEGELPRFRPTDAPIEEQVSRWPQEDARTKLTQPYQSLCLGVVLQAGGKLMGYVDLWYWGPDHLQVGLGVGLHSRYHRQGYGTEALRGVLGFCFTGLGLHRVTASCNSRNTAARRMLEKAGMRCEGEFLQNSFENREWISTVYFAMLSGEYRK